MRKNQVGKKGRKKKAQGTNETGFPPSPTPPPLRGVLFTKYSLMGFLSLKKKKEMKRKDEEPKQKRNKDKG